MYPVGSIYLSADANFDPNTAFGGTWQKIENRFLLGSGSRAVGATGGEENVTLNINQIPSHTHNRGDMNINGNIYNNAHGGLYLSCDGAFTTVLQNNGTGNGTGGGQMDTIHFNANRNWAGNVSWNGGSQAHNNMPPYMVIAIWKRTA